MEPWKKMTIQKTNHDPRSPREKYMRMAASPCERSSLGHVLISLIYSHTGYVCSCEHDGFYFKEMPQHVVGVQPPVFSWHPTRPTGPDKRRISNLNSALWQ